jgi:hypothetical protein
MRDLHVSSTLGCAGNWKTYRDDKMIARPMILLQQNKKRRERGENVKMSR